jgi:hypothetical protein
VSPTYGAGGPGGNQTEPMGITSLVLGVISLPAFACCSVFALVFNIAGLVFGFVSLSRINREPNRYSSKGLTVAALIVNGVLLVISILLAIFVFGMWGLSVLSP